MHQKQFWMVNENEFLLPGDYIPAEVSNKPVIQWLLK